MLVQDFLKRFPELLHPFLRYEYEAPFFPITLCDFKELSVGIFLEIKKERFVTSDNFLGVERFLLHPSPHMPQQIPELSTFILR